MFNLNYPQNSLQASPFHDLHDREFHILNGSCHLQIDNLKDLDLYNLLPNSDKSDDADPDHISINPQSDYYDIPSLNKVLSKTGAKSSSFLPVNISSLSKNISLLEDMLYSFKSTAWCIRNFWNQTKWLSWLTTTSTKLIFQPRWEGLLFMSVKL